VEQGFERDGGSVGLPDGVEITHGKSYGFAGMDALGNVDEDAVTKFGGVVEPKNAGFYARDAAEVFEDAFAAETTHGVFADGIERIGFFRATLSDGSESVDISGGECGDAAFGESLTDETGKKTVHRPSERFLAGGAEFHSGHVDDVACFGKTRERGRIEQIARDRLDVPGLKFFGKRGGRKAGDGEDAAGNAGRVGSAARHAS